MAEIVIKSPVQPFYPSQFSQKHYAFWQSQSQYRLRTPLIVIHLRNEVWIIADVVSRNYCNADLLFFAWNPVPRGHPIKSVLATQLLESLAPVVEFIIVKDCTSHGFLKQLVRITSVHYDGTLYLNVLYLPFTFTVLTLTLHEGVIGSQIFPMNCLQMIRISRYGQCNSAHQLLR